VGWVWTWWCGCRNVCAGVKKVVDECQNESVCAGVDVGVNTCVWVCGRGRIGF